jgi:WD40 repeat protein
MILSLSAVGEDFFIELYSEHAREGTYPRRQYQIVNLSTSVVDRELDMTESFSGGYPVCSPNNKLVAIGHRCFASIIEVVCFESGETLYSIRPPENVQPYLAFSPNSRNLTWSDSSVINRKDKNCVYIHDAESGDLATRLTVDGKMHFLEYAPSGRILAVWAYSKPAISFWDAGSHQMLGSTRHVAKRCCFSSDSRFFASAAASIQIADLEPDICTGASKTT